MCNEATPRGTLSSAQTAAKVALQKHTELCSELNKLFSGESDDVLVVARARRFLEVLVVDHYITAYGIEPPYKGQLKTLFLLIETMRKDGRLSQVLVALCHEVRLLGNRAVHYAPERELSPKFQSFQRGIVQDVVIRCAEIAELLQRDGESSVFVATLPSPFRQMYQHFSNTWRPALRGKKVGKLAMDDTLELILRSVISTVSPNEIDILERYDANNALPSKLPKTEEDGLRQLRNLGMISQDGEWLFTPTRSSSVRPTWRGLFLLALRRRNTCAPDAIRLAENAIKGISLLVKSNPQLQTLISFVDHPHIDDNNRDAARKLRNMNLLSHPDPYLASAEEVFLTALGYYVVGKYIAD